ncbi:PTS sugar transporter subunit IIA [Sporolactobacillus shoreae]|uniref:PTS sugar transporter subunit IIA n=1 Tax=Sporolactobacillus shoreae TaxID=1465501 RepID=A0A4Z0GSS0_9BACL|nr:PTS sugar transporter subunit IIA [Sporolactobacillus shoreae]
MPVGIILVSHGNFAKEVLASAEMIIGEIENIQAVCMTMDDGSSGLKEKMEQALERFSNREGVLIIADLPGGTPCNVASVLAQSSDGIAVMTGLNLAIVVEASVAGHKSLRDLTEYLVSIGKDSIHQISFKSNSETTEDEYDE